MNEKKVLAIVPAYNEEHNIEDVVTGLKSCGVPLDVVVINDGSSDKTTEVAQNAGAVVVTLPCNLGIGGAVQTGLIYARDKDYDVAIQVDGDGQHKPEEIHIILDPVLKGETDVAIGSRFLGKKGFKSSATRRLGISIFRAAIYIATRQLITDNTSGFRAFNKQAIAYLADKYPCDYPEVEVIVALKKNRFRMKEYPVEMLERHSGRSSITPIKSAYYMVKVLLAVLVSFLRSSDRPMGKL